MSSSLRPHGLNEAHQASLSITDSQNLLKLMSIKSVMPIQPFHPLSSTSPPGFTSFRTDRFDLLAVQGTLKNLLQNHSLKVSILLCSDFFMVQLSHLYMMTGKTMALTRWTCVGKVTSLLFNMLSRFVIAFLLRSKSLNFMVAVTVPSDV